MLSEEFPHHAHNKKCKNANLHQSWEEVLWYNICDRVRSLSKIISPEDMNALVIEAWDELLKLPISFDLIWNYSLKKKSCGLFNIQPRITTFSLAFSKAIETNEYGTCYSGVHQNLSFHFHEAKYLFFYGFNRKFPNINRSKQCVDIYIQSVLWFELSTHPLYPNDISCKHHWWVFHFLLKCARKQEQQ